MDLTWIFEPL